MIEHITNPLEYIECIIAFDPLDWSTDSRHAAIYAIALGWSDEAYTELQNKFNWNDEAIKRLKEFHEEWKRLKIEERRTSDLIDRQAAIDAIRKSASEFSGFMEMEMYTVDDAIKAVNTVPSKEPVRHGKNVGTDYDEMDQFVCSECGIELQGWYRVERDEDDGEETIHEYRFRYCPQCGVRISE